MVLTLAGFKSASVFYCLWVTDTQHEEKSPTIDNKLQQVAVYSVICKSAGHGLCEILWTLICHLVNDSPDQYYCAFLLNRFPQIIYCTSGKYVSAGGL